MKGVRAAATVMLVRDRPELEVLVQRRSPHAVFGPGATVFPGGAVDPADAAAEPRVIGLDDAAASVEQGLARGGLALRIAAVRECFEEAGVLLTRDRAGQPAAADVAWRDALNAGHATIGQVLEAEDLVIDARDLHVFSHWLTPVGAPRRYDTWFFAARAPSDQEPAADDAELVDWSWIAPADALERSQRGEIELIFPTLRSLLVLGRFPTTGALFDALNAAPRDDFGRRYVGADGSGERVVLPGDDRAAIATWTIPLPDLDGRAEARLLATGGE
ncbi:MAG: NUDIX hydrolase [Actinomycetota bacterium]